MSSKFNDPVLVVNKIYYTRKVDKDKSLVSSEPKVIKEYYRVRKRLYLRDIYDIEEYKEGSFDHFSDSPITRINTTTDQFLAEISFEMLSKMLDDFDNNKLINISN